MSTKTTSSCDEDVEQVIKHFQDLRPIFCYDDGREKTLSALDGTIPVKVAGVTHTDIPVFVLLQNDHPNVSPLVYVKPTSSMTIMESQHVDKNGLVFHPYLNEWNYYETSSIKTLLQILCRVFAKHPPVYAYHAHTSHNLGQQQPSSPNNPPSPSNQLPPSNPMLPSNPILPASNPQPPSNRLPPSNPMLPPPMASNPPRSSQQPQGHVHQDKPDAPICSDFLLGKCTKGSKCSGHHCSLPFHWQYKILEVNEWKSFRETDNEKLEKLYCDVMLEECPATGFHISFTSDGFLLLDTGDDANFLLDNKLIVHKGFEITQIRRLSTESYAMNPGNPVATVWTWYWKDENEIWRQYDVDQLGRDLQRSFEEAFLNKTNCFKFRISGQYYALYFSPPTDMHQKNVRYDTTRKVRRRPAEVKSGADILELKRSSKVLSTKEKPEKNTTSAKVPSHWSSMPSDEKYKRVPLTAMSSEYKEVKTLFKRTMKKSVTINSIERVQNPFMWEKYQRKKENMMAVKTGGHKQISVDERRLFHGTSPETVEHICKQNFDWRLHGKNATKYGEGSYFALNASCSDGYAKEDVNSSQFMFLAKVLVGSYTKGRSSYRKPPQKDPSNPASDLYDSCVDHISNPTKFVVFDIDQCYPDYIIKYSQENVSTARSQTTYGGFQQPVTSRPVSKPIRLQRATSYSAASQVHPSVAAYRPSVYSTGSSTSGGFGVPSYGHPQQPVTRRSVRNPKRSQSPSSYSRPPQLHTSQSVAALKPSRALGTPGVYSSRSNLSKSHSGTFSDYF